MNAQEFNELDFEQQDNLLYTSGHKLTTIEEEWFDIDIYLMENFYVEYRMPKDHDADDIKAFEKEEFEKNYNDTIFPSKPSLN